MKISELIDRLEEILIDHGDLDFVVCTPVDGSFIVEGDREIDVIKLEHDDVKKVALLNFNDEEVDDPEDFDDDFDGWVC